MGSAVQYLERDPFERLSTTTTIQHQSSNCSMVQHQNNNTIHHQNKTSAGNQLNANAVNKNSAVGRPSSAPPSTFNTCIVSIYLIVSQEWIQQKDGTLLIASFQDNKNISQKYITRLRDYLPNHHSQSNRQ